MKVTHTSRAVTHRFYSRLSTLLLQAQLARLEREIDTLYDAKERPEACKTIEVIRAVLKSRQS